MDERIVKELAHRTAKSSPQELLDVVLETFGRRVALATSLGAEDQVLADMLCRLTKRPRIFTLDTGRLPQETYDAIEAVNTRYNIRVEVLFPDTTDVEALVTEHGPNSFRQSVAARENCCYIRKVLPLRRRLSGLDAWITGLRREQTASRGQIERIAWDEANGRIKISPLADWTEEQVWQYLRENKVPYNVLHDRGYRSIGCACCTRPVKPGEDLRSGRWWWETLEAPKECGLHVVDGKLVPKKGR
ncbi:MAG: phosphoadenylyl-sulfate reductase [Planctomycetota bacterium]|nr:phosphoadenylyl-sulfate reductase [Planctomycetota bacterium]